MRGEAYRQTVVKGKLVIEFTYTYTVLENIDLTLAKGDSSYRDSLSTPLIILLAPLPFFPIFNA